MEFGGGERSGEGGVRVAEDEDRIRLLGEEDFLDGVEHTPGLRAVAAGADSRL